MRRSGRGREFTPLELSVSRHDGGETNWWFKKCTSRGHFARLHAAPTSFRIGTVPPSLMLVNNVVLNAATTLLPKPFYIWRHRKETADRVAHIEKIICERHSPTRPSWIILKDVTSSFFSLLFSTYLQQIDFFCRKYYVS